ncbi:toprim domain protein [Oikeobacillus pervagus]|uniref:Toprim domain protein n=1 Tax=Oikeobacillus pervagus TaxID=1325931 RepID=A0AAJ1T1M6_9BACI|nr:toprim domain-containing protein [Oikeobacillus pervagus]MDQ0215137.1 toprim domain protein [Oikeobacillus pervagus]
MDLVEEKVIIVEGTTDKRKIKTVIKEPVEIICTNGTIGLTKIDELVDELLGRDVYILVDADDSGEKLRKLFKQEFPEAKHLYIDRMYKEVATAPYWHLCSVLLSANLDVHSKYVEKDEK